MRDGDEPRFIRVLALIGPLALAGFGAVGLLLADLGVYEPWLVAVLGFVAFAALYQCARPLLEPADDPETAESDAELAAETGTDHDDRAADVDPDRPRPPGSGRVCALLAALLAAGTAVWNFMNAAQHAQINRDGGLYLNAGKWISAHGTLNLEPFVGPFANNQSVIATSTGMKLRGDHLEFDLSHMLSAVLAEAHNLGGNRLMFGAIPILSGFALLAFYRLAVRLLGKPVAALGATATLAFLMPQVSFSRDSTTEIPIQVLLFTAIWMLCDRRTLRSPRLAFVAGFLLGVIQAMHIDALVYVIGLPVVYALVWLHTNRAGRQRLKRGFAASAGGVLLGMAFGVVDILLWDRYYLSVLQSNVASLAAVTIASIIVSVALVVLVRRTGVWRLVGRVREQTAYFVGAWVAILGFGAWFLRPYIQHVHSPPNEMVAFVQRINGLHEDATRRYAEYSVRWMSWYAGPITVTLAILGAAGLSILLVRGTLRLPVRVATFMFAPPALLYTLRPSITPDQIWAMRRFLPVIFPVLVLLAWAVISAIAHAEAASLRRSFAIVLGLATILYPIITIRDVSQMTEQRNLMPIITNACHIIGPHGAVVVLQDQPPRSVAYLSDPQTIRSFCDVPVVIASRQATKRTLQSLAAEWRKDGRRLFAVDEHAQAIRSLFPSANVRTTGRRQDLHILEQTLTRRPERFAPAALQVTIVHELAVAPIPLPAENPEREPEQTPSTTTTSGATSTSSSTSTTAGATTSTSAGQ